MNIVQNYFALNQNNWFESKEVAKNSILFKDNTILFNLNFVKVITPLYLISGDSGTTKIGSNHRGFFDVLFYKKIILNIDVKFNVTCEFSIFILEFNDKEKIAKKSFKLKDGLNRINHFKNKDTRYIKLAFRIFSKKEQNIILLIKQLSCEFSKTIDNKVLLIYNKPLIDKNFFLLQNNESRLYNFKPRQDTPIYKLELPLDWSINPYRDINWSFQLHSWRMLDYTYLTYDSLQNLDKLIESLNFIRDWERYTVQEKNSVAMTWNDMSTGIRALKLGFLINRVFKAKSIEKVSKDDKEMLLRLAKLHINELRKQKISINNHGIFQVHGLMILSWLFFDTESMEYALGYMNRLINQQFYSDGFHCENSDDYHWFIYKTFERIVSFEPYMSNRNIQSIMKRANDCKVWTVFPNNQSLSIGDSNNSFRKIEISYIVSDSKNIIKFFEDSGYLFIRSAFNTPKDKASMLFFQTAYKNKTHRHADDFNILLYEYGMNILVDSGKYAYHADNNRKYVLSTRAHNCVMIGNMNYDILGKEIYKSVLEYYIEEDGVFKIKTSIYRSYIETVHNRVIIYKPMSFCIVIDFLNSKEKREYDQFWHFHQDLNILQKDKKFITNIKSDISIHIEPFSINLDKRLFFSKNKIQNSKLIKGQIKPEIQGWRSLRYKEIIENYALQNSIKAKKAILVTKFIFNKKDFKRCDLEMKLTANRDNYIYNFTSNLFEFNFDINL